MSEEAKNTVPETEQPETAPEEKTAAAAPEQAAVEAATEEDKKKDGGWFNKKAREMEAVKAKLDAAEKNAAQAKDQLLRMAAEYDNYRKRSTREADQKFGDGVSHAVEKIIPILDTLDMAANAPTTDENYKKGVVMTLDITCIFRESDTEETLYFKRNELIAAPGQTVVYNGSQKFYLETKERIPEKNSPGTYELRVRYNGKTAVFLYGNNGKNVTGRVE